MAYDDRDEELDDLDIRRHGGPHEPIPNYLMQSILVTLCCCWPFGIVAIVNAAKVNSLVARGEYELAHKASEDAKKWCWLSLIFGIIVGVLWTVFQLMSEQRGF